VLSNAMILDFGHTARRLAEQLTPEAGQHADALPGEFFDSQPRLGPKQACRRHSVDSGQVDRRIRGPGAQDNAARQHRSMFQAD
jgi:hypothetical protein